jgi:acyl-coenzyme A thioesterase PaaI-like protein
MTDLPTMIAAALAEKFRPHPDGADLPPHHEQCLGCGPGNAHGYHLQVRREGDGVVAEHTFDNRHVGAPGIAHGGAVATVIDDLYGFLLYLVGTPAVTRQLTVEYRAPVLIGVSYRIEAHVGSQEGRKLFLAASVTDPDGHQVGTSTAVFVTVTPDHFTRGMQ